MPRSKSTKRPARTLRLDRVFPGLGRIAVYTRTTRRSVFNELDAMLTVLFTAGRYDLLGELRDAAKRPLGQRLTPLFLLDAFRRGRLDQLPTTTSLRPLVESFRAWTVGGNTRKGEPWSRWYAQAHRSVEHRIIAKARPGAPVAELPLLLAVHRRAYANRKKTFDNDRTILLGFARDVCGRQSACYLQVAAVEPYRPGRMNKTHPQTVAELTAWTTAPDADTAAKVDPDTAACCWAMATTGMGPGEYWGSWERRLDRIVIHGTKREARERVVPDLGRCTEPPRISRQAFEDRLAEQTGGAFKPYDLRRTFVNWLEEAGVKRTRRRIYLGHKVRDVTDLYEDHDVTQFLREDAKVVRRWITEQIAAQKTARKAAQMAEQSHHPSHHGADAAHEA